VLQTVRPRTSVASVRSRSAASTSARVAVAGTMLGLIRCGTRCVRPAPARKPAVLERCRTTAASPASTTAVASASAVSAQETARSYAWVAALVPASWAAGRSRRVVSPAR
jgi:hypothetical protein